MYECTTIISMHFAVDKMWTVWISYPHPLWITLLHISVQYIGAIHASLFVDKMWISYPHPLWITLLHISVQYIEPLYEADPVDKMWKTYPHFVWISSLKIFDCEEIVRKISCIIYRPDILYKINVDSVENLSTFCVENSVEDLRL